MGDGGAQGSDNPASDSTFHMSALESGNGPPPGADTGTGTGTAPKVRRESRELAYFLLFCQRERGVRGEGRFERE